jgi:hypothetical protein
MGQYCKAYPLSAMRQFPGWRENANGDPPDNDHIVYLQENYVVTDGIFIDENVIFDEVNDAWIEFCQKTLNFELPATAAAANA